MIKKFEKTISVNGKNTKIFFWLEDEYGLNLEQVTQICLLAEKYLERYPCIHVNEICDYCYMDYGENEYAVDYFWDDENIEYESRDDLARYFWDDKIIGFNHIRCHSLEYDDLELKKGNTPWNVSGDITQIKRYERRKTIKTLFIHELGHAIENQLKIYEDAEMIKLYETCSNGRFADIHEFIAECFVVFEYFPLNGVVLDVMTIVSKYVRKAQRGGELDGERKI